MLKTELRITLLLLWLTCRFALSQDATTTVTILYSGKSLGALGFSRSQEENDLLIGQIVAAKRPFKVVSHPAWRAPGITVFLPSQDPKGEELDQVLQGKVYFEKRTAVPVLSSASNLMVTDPWRADEDLLGIIWNNPARLDGFPDLVRSTATVSRFKLPSGERAYILEEAGAVWPTDISAWEVSEMTRIDVGTSRLFALPMNVGGMGPRATLIRTLSAGKENVLKVDLGHEDGDLGMSRMERAKIDYDALSQLGYRYVVPYEFELELGADSLRKVLSANTGITLLGANILMGDTTFVRPRAIVEMGDFKVGLVGLVNESLRDRLTRGILSSVTFEPSIKAARRECEKLRKQGVSAIIVLSNLNPAENALIAQEVKGIDAIIADMPLRTAPERIRVSVELPDRPYSRPGTPGMVARSAAEGVAIGLLELGLQRNPDNGNTYAAALTHELFPVNDRTPSDEQLMERIRSRTSRVVVPRGEALFPAFTELVGRHPDLGEYDAVTRLGRVSKPMWEAFMARRVRVQGNSEVAVIRRLDRFSPLTGKLREQELLPWLWVDDAVILLDMPGSDLRALLASDSRNELSTSGIDFSSGKILGHNIEDNNYYRVATTDILFEGGRARYFNRARRVRRLFTIDPVSGALLDDAEGKPVGLREFILGELKLVRNNNKGDAHLDKIAELIRPDPRHVNLFSFYFDRPTIWASFNQVNGNEGYNLVPESRVLAKNAFVAGTNGRFAISRLRQKYAADLGFLYAYAIQKVFENGTSQRVESTDDYRIDLTLRPSPRRAGDMRPQPFLRGLFDSEFTPTVDDKTGIVNPRQRSLRAVAGMLLFPGPNWRRTDAGLLIENDFGRPNPQLGFQSRSEYEKRFSIGQHGGVTYRLRNDLTWFFPAPKDTKANLSLRYQMVHELLVPLVDELSLSVAADLFFFRGKVKELREPGLSTLLRVGITYDRLWKPRYQPFF